MSTRTSDTINFRYVCGRDAVYLHIDDVAALLESFAATEKTDVRNRVRAFVSNLLSKFKDHR